MLGIFNIIGLIFEKLLTGSLIGKNDSLSNSNIISSIFDNNEETLKKTEILERLSEKQIDLAKSFLSCQNVFMAGWWALIGWTCSIALLYNFIVIPIINEIFSLNINTFEMDNIQDIIYLLLGMGTLRTTKTITEIISQFLVKRGK